MKDFLHINDTSLVGMRAYCTQELIEYVLDKVKEKENNREIVAWSLTDLISSNKDDIINIMNVVLAFLYTGGYVIYDNKLYCKILDFTVEEKELFGIKFSMNKGEYAEETQFIATVKENGLLSDEELGILYDPWMKTTFEIRDIIK